MNGVALGTEPRSVTILGSTGSIGRNTVDLIERHPGAYRVEALTGNTRIAELIDQALRLRPRFVATADPDRYTELKQGLVGTGIEVGAGAAAVCEAAQRDANWVMAAIVGAAGLEPTLRAIRRGVIVALANKECLVCAGELAMAEVARHGATLLPVDSEHNAIFQVLDPLRRDAVERIILTASGGPFLSLDRAAMAKATPAQAVAHPNWTMGAKISVDSATLMNKGLELIEAFHLFGLPEDRLDILIHPQSVIHSMVAYVDGSVLAQLGSPDMRTPIAYTLGWPRRIAAPSARLDLAAIGRLTFEAPDPVRFPALRVAREALRAGGSAPTILSAANEVAVAGFLAGRIGFLDIAAIVEDVLQRLPATRPTCIADVVEIDAAARRLAEHRIGHDDRVAVAARYQ